VDLVDYDGDGDLDLFVGNAGQNLIYLNDGAGLFDESMDIGGPTGSTYAVELIDLDQDGDLDVINGNRDDGGHVLLNN